MAGSRQQALFLSAFEHCPLLCVRRRLPSRRHLRQNSTAEEFPRWLVAEESPTPTSRPDSPLRRRKSKSTCSADDKDARVQKAIELCEAWGAVCE